MISRLRKRPFRQEKFTGQQASRPLFMRYEEGERIREKYLDKRSSAVPSVPST